MQMMCKDEKCQMKCLSGGGQNVQYSKEEKKIEQRELREMHLCDLGKNSQYAIKAPIA